MKTKDLLAPVLLIVLGVAFLAVSLWVIFSKNQKSIRAKYKIGGMILSLSFFAAAHQSCITCYAPPYEDYLSYSFGGINQEMLISNDTVFVTINGWNYRHFSYELLDSTRQIIFETQKLEAHSEYSAYYVPLNAIPSDYSGYFFLSVYGENDTVIART